MSTMTTLFGGLAAVFALYAVGGLIRNVPPMLRAVLAGLIPLLGYFVFIVGRWPGLDVVAMHISVFLAAGLVLFAVSQFRRRSAGHMHWVPKLLVAFFIGLVVVNGSLLYIATKGLPEPIGRWWLGSEGGAGLQRLFPGWWSMDKTPPRPSHPNSAKHIVNRDWAGRSRSVDSTPENWNRSSKFVFGTVRDCPSIVWRRNCCCSAQVRQRRWPRSP